MEKLSKAGWCLLGCVIVLIAFGVGSVFVPNGFVNAVKWLADSEPAHKLRALSEQEPAHEKTLIEMVVDNVGVSETSYQPVVVLKEKDGTLYLPIWIGLLEANAISVILEKVEVPRPLTPDLLCSITDRMGAIVERIVVNDLQDDIFYASIFLKANWTKMEVDARPSDAIAVALRAVAPIYVEKAVLDKAGIQREDRSEKSTRIN